MAPNDTDVWSSTLTLLSNARQGDPQALDDIFIRHLPELREWASGRLPAWTRDLADTQDVVQDVLTTTIRCIGDFEHRGQGALRAYLRQAVMNRIRDHIRRRARRPAHASLDALDESPPVDSGPTPFDTAVGHEVVLRYEQALDRLPAADRDLVVARVELQMTYAEIAAAASRPSPDAVRMAVSRAMRRLAEEMHVTSGVAR